MVKILIIDDNEESTRTIREGLLGSSYEILEARDGLMGLILSKMARPDLILLDLDIVKTDALKTTQVIRSGVETEWIPIIALSPSDADKRETEVLEAGCNDIHARPIRFPGLKAQIEGLLN